MKKIFILWTILSCGFAVARAQDAYKIVGSLGGTLGGNLTLVASGPRGAVTLAEAVMTNGSFVFTGRVDSLVAAYVMTDQQQPIATVMLENAEYVVEAGETGIEVRGGGEAQRILSEYDAVNNLIRRERMKMEQEVQAAYASGNQMKMQALQQQFQKVMEDAGRQQAELFGKYKDSPVTAFVIASGMGQMDYASLKALYDDLGEGAKRCLYGQMVAQQIEVFKQVEVGAVAPDFTVLTSEGDTVSLHALEGKVKLLDFWASWCAPCRAEMPNVRKVYKKYSEAGLAILGVSIDQKAEDWLRALDEEKLPWPNAIDQQGVIANRYLVRAIPHTVLLDGNNVIVAKNLRGKELEAKIAELLGKK